MSQPGNELSFEDSVECGDRQTLQRVRKQQETENISES